MSKIWSQMLDGAAMAMGSTQSMERLYNETMNRSFVAETWSTVGKTLEKSMKDAPFQGKENSSMSSDPHFTADRYRTAKR